MLAVNKKRNKRKIDTAKKEIYKMLENGEKVTVTKLIEQTGLSRGFFYKNEEVRALLDRAVEQQAGMVLSLIHIFWIKSSFPFCVQPAGKSQNCFKRCYGTGKRKYPQS